MTALLGSVQSTVLHGSPLLAALFAFAAGLLSFFSPCVLPLVPGYVAFLGGAAGAQAAAPPRPRHLSRTLAGAIAFVLGFSFIYVTLGTAFGSFGHALRDHERGLAVAFGLLTVLLGLFFAGWLPGASMLNREVRVHWLPRATVVGAAILGLLFGIGWSPCIGPTLGAILALTAAAPGATAWRGTVLAAVYCLGLGVPFLVAAVATDSIAGVSRFVRRHYAWLMRIGGAMLVVIGVLEVTGTWTSFVRWIQDHFTSFQTQL